MNPFSTRLRHIVTRADWVALLSSTYAAAHSVEDDIALDRLEQALHDGELQEALTLGLQAALAEHVGRGGDDDLLDRFAKALQKRRTRVRAAPTSAELSAVLVRIDLALGLAPATLRDTLESDKGAKLLAAGYRALGGHLAREILR